MTVVISQLSVSKSKRQILTDINLQILPEEVVCIAGRNGAGKTTLLRSMLGMEPDVTGETIINGIDMRSYGRNEALQQIGVFLFPDSSYAYLSGRANIDIIRRLYPADQVRSADELAELAGLTDVIDRPVKTYSTGMKQRLNIALALVNRPSLLVLDEPFNSVDQEHTLDIVRLIQRLNQTEKLTILLSTHVLHEVEELYSRFVFIQKGRIRFDQSRAVIRTHTPEQLLILQDHSNSELYETEESSLQTTETSLSELYQRLIQ